MNAPELSSEDALRLAVLLAGELEAVRIDDGAMVLRALTPKGEAKIQLHPNCRPDQYLRRVRERLAEHALDSPGGYPVYLKRWTRMGQIGAKNLAPLLLLGEPEAVVAVAHAPGLTDQLARRAWWALPAMELARCMLQNESVTRGAMGRVLADFLIEHMAFEEDADANMQALRLILAAGLADETLRDRLWAKARRQPHYYIGFLEFLPDALPADEPARPDHAEIAAALGALARAGNPGATLLLRCASGRGQAFLKAADEVLRRPPSQATVYALLDVLGGYFRAARPEALAAAIEAAPRYAGELQAIDALSRVGAALAEPILTRTTAVGPLMRRKLEPLAAPLHQHIAILTGHARPPHPQPLSPERERGAQ